MATTQVSSSLIKDASVTAAKMADNSIDSDSYVDGSIDTAHLADDQVTVAKMAANSVDSDQYVDGSIDLVHMSANSVDSDQYVDGSIDLVHMSANSVDSDQYVDGSIDTAHIADDAVTSAKVANDIKVAGVETIWVPAAAMYPETTNGCADLEQVELSNGPELKCLDFAAAADDFAQFSIAFPKSWNEGTVTFQAFFTVTGTNTGTVAWGLAGRSFADSADLNTAFGTTVVATAKAHSGTSNDLDVTAVSGAVTIAGAAVDTLTCFQVLRDVSADSQSGAARLLGIKLFFTTNAANDA
jgi:hypothetical protein|tara:strand:+ start:218 stop:1111 length:894 start_codon:yes stop_codon:yes gene_type:complete